MMFLIHAYRVFRIMSVTIIKHFAQENIEISIKSRGAFICAADGVVTIFPQTSPHVKITWRRLLPGEETVLLSREEVALRGKLVQFFFFSSYSHPGTSHPRGLVVAKVSASCRTVAGDCGESWMPCSEQHTGIFSPWLPAAR